MTIWEDKTRKEAAKFDAETREIKKRLEAKPSRWDKSKEMVVYFTALVALFGGAFGLYKTVDSYFGQRTQEIEQAERAYDFNVNKEIIQLSQQLASDKAVERINAALLLSAFEQDAIPILVANLRVINKGDLPYHLVNAIEMILKKDKLKERARPILGYIAREAEAFVDSQYKSGGYDVRAIVNYIHALGQLGARAPGEVGPALDRISRKIQARNSRISIIDRDTLLLSISEATSKVAAGVGPSG